MAFMPSSFTTAKLPSISDIPAFGGGVTPEALEQLAERAGIDLPRGRAGMPIDERRSLHSVLAWARDRFAECLQGPDGVRARDYGDQLFSVTPKTGRPLLFSLSDKLPKYFGIESVTIPKLFHLREIQQSVMANFREIFEKALKEADSNG